MRAEKMRRATSAGRKDDAYADGQDGDREAGVRGEEQGGEDLTAGAGVGEGGGGGNGAAEDEAYAGAGARRRRG